VRPGVGGGGRRSPRRAAGEVLLGTWRGGGRRRLRRIGRWVWRLEGVMAEAGRRSNLVEGQIDLH
jgi:hypothetical protein